MFYLIINAICYLSFLTWIWYKSKQFTPGVLIVLLWTIVAVACIFYYPTDNFFIGKLTLWPFIYLYGTFLLFARIFFKDKKVYDTLPSIVGGRSRTMDFFCYIYVLCVVVNVIADGLNISQLAFSNIVDNASEAYSEHFNLDKEYANVWLRLTHVYEYYFYYIVLIVAFNSICQGRNLFSLLLIAIVFLKKLLDSAMVGDRTQIFVIVMLFAVLYSLYHRYMHKRTKKLFLVFSLLLGMAVLSYFLAVTISRFDNMHMGTGGSLLHYLGASMLYFDHGLVDYIKDYFGGVATFSGLLERIGIDPPIDIYYNHVADYLLGTRVGSYFITFIGTLYMDFGFILTIIIAIIWPPVINKLVFLNGRISYPGLYLYLFYFCRLARGVFTNGFNAAVMYYQAFLFYILLWIVIMVKNYIKKRLL